MERLAWVALVIMKEEHRAGDMEALCVLCVNYSGMMHTWPE